jgi:hypothetical protein
MMLHDVFICHASEDKDDIVRPLAEMLRAHHLAVWYDEFSLAVGDSLREAIDQGLASSRFGIVVLSPSFFQKRWTQRELNGLVSREMAEGRHITLPIWHDITHAEIVQHSPPMADLFALKTSDGLDWITAELVKILRPEASPLIVARDFLLEKGVTPPIITDEWWLDMVEFKEGQLRNPEPGLWRWIFPLPYSHDDVGKRRGLNIAWAALQRDWAVDAEDRNLCQLTHPEVLQDFLDEWPGLRDCAREYPGVLAMYAPQLALPGFDRGLEDVFDALLAPNRGDDYELPGYGGGPDTIDDKPPLCGELIAWRHPTFGNYADHELAFSFVRAHDGHYSRYRYDAFTCLSWLLTDTANWMLPALREYLLAGFACRDIWYDHNRGDAFHRSLLKKTKSQFRFTREIRTGLQDAITRALHDLGIAEAPKTITERFIERDIAGGFYRWRDEMRDARRQRG